MLILLLFSICVLIPQAPQAAGPMVGAQWCRTCHQAQFDAWEQGPHATAFNRLPPDQRRNPACLGCHVAEGVQCETCHGEGRNYSKDYIMKDHHLAEALGLNAEPMKGCLGCHRGEMPTTKDFNPASAWKRLPHSKANNAKK